VKSGIADTGPINYLVLIGQVDLLPRMFERVAPPKAVEAELSDMRAPLPVRRWIAAPPAWLEIYDTTVLPPRHPPEIDHLCSNRLDQITS